MHKSSRNAARRNAVHGFRSRVGFSYLLRPRGLLSVALSGALPGRTAMPSTVRLHRVLAAKPAKVYRAFIEADAMAKWLPPDGFACTVHRLDAKVGGTHRMSFRNFTTGMSHSFGGEY